MTDLNEMKKDWLSIAAHQLKTPIGAVQGFIELIQQTGPLNERQERYANRALAALDRTYSLLSALLEMSRIEGDLPLNQVQCDLRKIIGLSLDLVENLAEKRQISIHLDVSPDLETVLGDPHWLGQVMNNLLNNAIKYNRDGGDIWVRAFVQDDGVGVSIRDSGVGIDSDEIDHIFEKFFRSANNAQVEGSGLGLAIARSIVEKHHGEIWVESATGVGSTFTFILPRHRRLNDGRTHPVEVAHVRGEGREDLHVPRPELGTEELDAVSDDIQEASGSAPVDSSSDEV